LHTLGPFDAIVSDPPYGKREKGSLSAKGAAQEATHTLLTLAADSHILKVQANLSET
jgi:tRNA G10  N-methylase Trm11